MSAMPLVPAVLLLLSVIVIFGATQWLRLQPFLAILVVAAAFGGAAGFSISFIGKTFGNGFSQALYSPGLVIVAAAFVTGLADGVGANESLAAAAARWRSGRSAAMIAAPIGLIAGLAASPASAFALLTPLLRIFPGRRRAAIAAALGISAGHGLLLMTPVQIVAASILEARWLNVVLFGVPVAVLAAAAGAGWSRLVVTADKPAPTHDAATPPPAIAKRTAASAAIVVATAVAPLLLLMLQSIGDLPSEPLGGGPSRELVIGLGRPLILFLLVLVIATVGFLPGSVRLLASAAWNRKVLGNVAGILLAVGAAGGLQRLCQETGMAELLAEQLMQWHVAGPGALLAAFLVAALVKTLQGSSLVAAITAAGIVQPALPAIGAADEPARALMALAIGAGAMTFAHVNDEYFWLVADTAGLRPLRGFAAIGLGTLLQGIIAVAALLALSFFLHRL